MVTKVKAAKKITTRTYELVDTVPMQKELQRLADRAVEHVTKSTGGVVHGKLLIQLDYIYPRRDVVTGHFSKKGWRDNDGDVATIAINPYDMANMTDAQRFGVILHEAIHFVASFTENKILFGFKKNPKSTDGDGYSKDTTDGGRYHGPQFQKVAGMVTWLEVFKVDTARVGSSTKLSAAGIKHADKIVTKGIFNGLHKVLEPKSEKKGSQYVGYRCQDCDFSSQVSGGIAKAIDSGAQVISQHCGLDMVKK